VNRVEFHIAKRIDLYYVPFTKELEELPKREDFSLDAGIFAGSLRLSARTNSAAISSVKLPQSKLLP
jgi:hypothetical protein